jgi:hypothetical protein
MGDGSYEMPRPTTGRKYRPSPPSGGDLLRAFSTISRALNLGQPLSLTPDLMAGERGPRAASGAVSDRPQPYRDGGLRLSGQIPPLCAPDLYATVHQESPADGEFTFPADDPTATQGGQAALEPIYYTVNDGASGRANAGIRDDELPESGGVPPGVLLAAGALLLASSVAGFTLALRRGPGGETGS